MKNKPKRRTFIVEKGETIGDCLDRIKREGYIPVRRIEKPIFEETVLNGKTDKIPVQQQIKFETKLE
ncbi:NETI motif-containing protein [Alteribacillus sp. HJP-4]|uniref:NETI motif-containing protein n=1 Tax=Alteribacillus sp. HJP-4 TaxID=2775394 RepID=UPI0035CD1D5A